MPALVRTVLFIAIMLLQPVFAAETVLVGAASTGSDSEPDVLVWTAWGGPSLDWLSRQLDAFGRASGVSVGIEHMALGELRQRTLLAADSDERTADVLAGVPHDQISELIAAGLLADLSSFATADYLADLPEASSTAFRVDSRLLGLPLTLEGPALLVNTDLVPDLPRNYQQLLETAQSLERQPDLHGLLFDFSNFYFAWTWFGSNGARLPENGADQVDLTDAAWLRAAGQLQELRYTYELLPAGADYQLAHDSFSSGRLGFILDGPWAVARYFAAGVPLTVMPLPAPTGAEPSVGFVTVYGVLVTGGNSPRTVAVNAAKWLVRSAAQLDLAEQAGRIPASLQAVDELAADEILHGFGLALRHARPVPADPGLSAVWPVLGSFLAELDEAPRSEAQLLELLEQAEQQLSSH